MSERPTPTARLFDVLKRLHALGHAHEFPRCDESFLTWVFEDLGEELIGRYQRFHALPISGVLCRDTREHLARPRCAHPDVMPVAGVSSWAVRSLAYHQALSYPGVAPEEVAGEYAEAVRRMCAVCGLSVSVAAGPDAAQVVAAMGPIDGPWNVLALSELPPPGAPATTVLHQTFDQAETALTRDQRIAMMAHEFGHCLGLGHAQPGSGNLMEPVLGPITAPQAGDIAELQARYGPPVPGTPAPAPTPPSGPSAPAPAPAPAPACLLLQVPAAGTYGYDLTFESAGQFLLVVAPVPSS